MTQRKVRIGSLPKRNNAPTLFWTERDRRTGRLLRKTKTFPLDTPRKDIEHEARLKYVEINSPNRNGKGDIITWDELIEEYYAAKKRRNISGNFRRDIDNTFEKFVTVNGKPDNQHINQRMIDRFIDRRLEETRPVCIETFADGKRKVLHDKQAISPATINKDLRNLKAFIAWAKNAEYIHGCFTIIPLKTSRRPVRRLSNEEVKTLITGAADMPELRIGIIIGVYTGLRQGDIWALKRGQVDFTMGCLCDVIEQKTRKTTDYVRMSPVALLAVKRYIESTFGQPSDNLFRKPFPRAYWDKLRKFAGNCKFHDLRRTCASVLGGVAKSGWVATKQLGQSAPAVTGNHYINVDDEIAEAHKHMPTTEWGLTA